MPNESLHHHGIRLVDHYLEPPLPLQVVAQAVLPPQHRIYADLFQRTIFQHGILWPRYLGRKLIVTSRLQVRTSAAQFEDGLCKLIPRTTALGSCVIQPVAIGPDNGYDLLSELGGSGGADNFILDHAHFVPLPRELKHELNKVISGLGPAWMGAVQSGGAYHEMLRRDRPDEGLSR